MSALQFEGIASHDAIVEIAAVQTVIATSFMKIANDIRLLGSGPRAGEIAPFPLHVTHALPTPCPSRPSHSMSLTPFPLHVPHALPTPCPSRPSHSMSLTPFPLHVPHALPTPCPSRPSPSMSITPFPLHIPALFQFHVFPTLLLQVSANSFFLLMSPVPRSCRARSTPPRPRR
jgi:hypothetical protein